MKPSFRQEKKLWKKGYKRVVGLDEAGRGSLAGPVIAAATEVAAAKIRNSKSTLRGVANDSEIREILKTIKDSKKLTPAKRENLYRLIIGSPTIEWKIGRVSEKLIDKINIKNAAELAMFHAVQKLKPPPDFLIIDGKFLKNSKLKNMSHKLIIKADEKIFSCAAASIIAKVSRDRMMKKLHRKYPHYGLDQHKGYPTKYHRKMLKKYGPCKIHRKSFRPVKGLCEKIK